MARLRIDKLEITGEKGLSDIDFAENLTIIMGKSETGKTTVFKCIDYLFGAANDQKYRPFLTSTGYDTITGYFTCDMGAFTLTRKIDDKKITVSTKIAEIDSSTPYTIDSQNKRWIGFLFNQILGIDKNFKVPSSVDGRMTKFSWRTIKECFMIHEKRSDTNESIIMTKTKTNETAFLSHLLFILYNIDFSEYDAVEGSNIKKLRKKAVQAYITQKKEDINKKIDDLKKEHSETIIQEQNLDLMMNNLNKILIYINTELDLAVNENQKLATDLFLKKQKVTELNLNINRFDALESQYTSDIKRLSFIVDSEKLVTSKAKSSICPFCDGKVENHDHSSYINASRGELKLTIDNLNDLNETKRDIINELSYVKKTILNIESNININKQKMEKDLFPKQQSIQEQLKIYQEIIEYNKAMDMFKDLGVTYEEDFKNYNKSEAEIDYHPKDLFPKDFVIEIADRFRSILTAINYMPIENVEFNTKLWDIIVNDNPKSNRSKGYSAILNSLLILTLRSYINSVASLNPHFYFLDSPLHGLMTEANDENNADDLRKGFFKYLFENCDNDQIIVIENTDDHELPAFQYDESKVKIHTFTKDKEKGRYGLLKNVYQN